MALWLEDFTTAQALVIDGNPTSRSILVSQLREFGVGNVVQCSRLTDARRQLEHRTFDVVLCEHHFSGEASSGQELLDDLRRNQLLPFSTIFIMVTGEASYAQVAEAAESALDGYLLKPYKGTQLGERLRQARVRKISLQEIFAAIKSEDFESAASLCLQRFETKGKFWLYAARVGAELLLRTGKYTQAQALYEAVVAAKTLPWAKLGIARSQLDAGQVNLAAGTLDKLIAEDSSYADAYDVMGRAQFEMGKFEEAMATFKMGCQITPASISRLQNLGMMTYHNGERQEAERILERVTRIGLGSKMFDCQTLVLLGFARLENGDRKGLQRCRDDIFRVIEKTPENRRNHRLAGILEALCAIQDSQFAQALDAIRAMRETVKLPDFDFESGSNLTTLLSQLAKKSIQIEEVESLVDTLGMRLCTSRSTTDLLGAAAFAHEPYASRIRAAQTQILKQTEHAMSLSLGGDPKAAVTDLIVHGQATLNAKLIETAHLVLHRYADTIQDATSLNLRLQDLRLRFGTQNAKPSLGEQKRQAGGLTLRDSGGGAPKLPAQVA